MTITVLISGTAYLVIAGIYNYLLSLPILCLQQGHSSLPGGVTQTFISKGFGR